MLGVLILKTIPENVLTAAKRILSYLENNPDAKDDLTGISKWWINTNRSVTEKALEILVKNKKIKFDADKKLYSKL